MSLDEFIPKGIPIPEDAKEEMKKQFDAMDANKDGQLEKQEVLDFLMNQAMAVALPQVKEQLAQVKEQVHGELVSAFKKADANDDGFIDQDEFKVVKDEAAASGQGAEEMAFMVFEDMDENKDGKISQDEFVRFLGKVMRNKFMEELKKQF